MNKLLFPVLAIIAAVGIYFMYISSTWGEIVLLEEKKDDLASALMDAENAQQRIEELEESYGNISKGDLVKLDKLLPAYTNITKLTYEFINLLEENGFDSKDLSFSEVNATSDVSEGGTQQGTQQNAQPFSRIDVSFNVKTSYQGFIDFMLVLENNLRLTNLTSLNINASGGGGEDDGESSSSTKEDKKDYSVLLSIYSFE